MGLHDAASAARLKVSAALLPELRDASDSAAQRFHLDAPGWWQEPETPKLLPPVAEAVWGDLRLRVRYQRENAVVERELEPYGLVLKAGVWYLVARADGELRVYRVDRVVEAEVVTGSGSGSGSGGARFQRDPGVDLPDFWARHAAEFARSILRTEAVVRLSAAGARRLPQVTDRAAAREALAAAGPPDGEGWVTVTLPVEGLDVAYGQLLALGPEAEVVGPADLRERFASAAERLAAMYA
jgi:predicted DNA-binding transcriptional regulator YafY